MPPRIITARSIGLRFRTGRMGKMGPEQAVIGHYSARPRASHFAAGIAQVTAIHKDHLKRGWAGIGYHFAFPDDGSIICCRPTSRMGAHVLNSNKGKIGVVMLGGADDKPTHAQARAFNWLLNNAHTDAMPRRHRTDRKLDDVPVSAHNDFLPTACPGLFRSMILRHGEPFIEGSADSGDVAGDGFVEPTTEDQERLAAAEAGDMSAPEAEAATIGPDEDELRSEGDDATELPEADPDFDEDLSDVLADIEAQRDHPTPR